MKSAEQEMKELKRERDRVSKLAQKLDRERRKGLQQNRNGENSLIKHGILAQTSRAHELRTQRRRKLLEKLHRVERGEKIPLPSDLVPVKVSAHTIGSTKKDDCLRQAIQAKRKMKELLSQQEEMSLTQREQRLHDKWAPRISKVVQHDRRALLRRKAHAIAEAKRVDRTRQSEWTQFLQQMHARVEARPLLYRYI
ncbi:MAG: hypothetical protein MHM6MM_006382 [Cercozoa sp. M6MM]